MIYTQPYSIISIILNYCQVYPSLMIYSTQNQWQGPADFHHLRKQSILILDLSILHKLIPELQNISSKTNIPVPTLLKQYEEIISDLGGLKEFINAIIVRMESFNQRVDKQELRGLNKPKDKSCLFDMLVSRYQGELHIGVDIPIQKSHEFPPSYIDEDQLKNIKIFSVRMRIEDLDKLEFLKKYKFVFPKQTIHINLELHKPEDLIEFQRFLVVNEYPIQFIVLTVNLLSVLKSPPFAKDQNVSLKQSSSSTIAYHYHKYLERFINGAFQNVCEYYELPFEQALQYGDSEKDGELDNILKILMEIIRRRRTKLGCFQGGLVVPSTLLLPSLKKFSGGYEADLLMAAYIQRYGFTSLRLAMNGQFKTMKPIQN